MTIHEAKLGCCDDADTKCIHCDGEDTEASFLKKFRADPSELEGALFHIDDPISSLTRSGLIKIDGNL